jgi:hypothetical protein
MVSRRSLLALLVGAFVCALALSAPSFSLAAGRVPQGFVGVDVDGPLYPVTAPGADLPGQLDAMVASGVQSLRVTFDWSWAQPYQRFSQVPAALRSQFTSVGGIPTRFSEMDTIVGLAAQRGLTVLPTVIYAPNWDATSHPIDAISTPKRTGPYANFVSALVHRYGPQGSFWASHSPKVAVRMWQIWNEPNIHLFWPKQPFQPAYVALLRAAHNAIKRADRGAKVVLAGMPNFSWTQLDHIYKIRGAGALFDVVSVHPYTKNPQGVITILQKVRAVMNAHGDKHKPLLADEISWPSSQGQTTHTIGFDFVTTPHGQAGKLAKVIPLLGKNRVKLGLMGFDYYTWAGVEIKNGLAFDFSGLERFTTTGQFVAKPALAAFRHGALGLEGCRQKGSRATICLH